MSLWCYPCRSAFVESAGRKEQICPWCDTPVEAVKPIDQTTMQRTTEVMTLFHLTETKVAS